MEYQEVTKEPGLHIRNLSDIGLCGLVVEIPKDRQGIYDDKGDLVMVFNPNPYGTTASEEAIPRSVIYFMQSGDKGSIKIGYTEDLDKRLSQLRSMSPTPLYLLGAIEGSRQAEEGLHAQFSHLRDHHEWYHAQDELLTYINGVG